jgi:hypothetical protein
MLHAIVEKQQIPVLGFTRLRLKPTTFCTPDKDADHHITDLVVTNLITYTLCKSSHYIIISTEAPSEDIYYKYSRFAIMCDINKISSTVLPVSSFKLNMFEDKGYGSCIVNNDINNISNDSLC